LNYKNLLLSLPLATILLSGCGSDSSSNNNTSLGDNNDSSDINNSVNIDENNSVNIDKNNPILTVSGKVIDGYISGAEVFIDLNKNFEVDSEEPKTTTDENGAFQISSSIESGTYRVVSIGGTDSFTEESFDNTLYTTIEIKDKNLTDVYLSPISTVISASYEQSGNNSSLDEIKEMFLTELGLETEKDIMHVDFIELAMSGEDSSIFFANQKVITAINLLKNDIEIVSADNQNSEQEAISSIIATGNLDRESNLAHLGFDSLYISGIAVESEPASDSGETEILDDSILPDENSTREEILEFLKNSQADFSSQVEEVRQEAEEIYSQIDLTVPDENLDGEIVVDPVEPTLPTQVLPFEIELLKQVFVGSFEELCQNAGEEAGDIEITFSEIFDLESGDFKNAELLEISKAGELVENKLEEVATLLPQHFETVSTELDNFTTNAENEFDAILLNRLGAVDELIGEPKNVNEINFNSTNTILSGDEVTISAGENNTVLISVTNENGTNYQMTYSLNIDEDGNIAENGNEMFVSGDLIGDYYSINGMEVVSTDTNNSMTISSFKLSKEELSLVATDVEMVNQEFISVSGEVNTSTFTMNGTLSQDETGLLSLSGSAEFENNLSFSGNAEILFVSNGGTPPAVPEQETMRVIKSEMDDFETVSISVDSNGSDFVTYAETIGSELAEYSETMSDEVMAYADEVVSSFDGNGTELLTYIEDVTNEFVENSEDMSIEITEYANELAENGVVTDDMISEFNDTIAEIYEEYDTAIETIELDIQAHIEELVSNYSSEDTSIELLSEGLGIIMISAHGVVEFPEARVESNFDLKENSMYLSNVSITSENLSINIDKVDVQSLGYISTESVSEETIEEIILPENEDSLIDESVMEPNEETNDDLLPPPLPEDGQNGVEDASSDDVENSSNEVEEDDFPQIPTAEPELELEENETPEENPVENVETTEETTEENVSETNTTTTSEESETANTSEESEEEQPQPTGTDVPPSFPMISNLSTTATNYTMTDDIVEYAIVEAVSVDDYEMVETIEYYEETTVLPQIEFTGMKATVTTENGNVVYSGGGILLSNGIFKEEATITLGETSVEMDSVVLGNFIVENSKVSSGDMEGMITESFSDENIQYFKVITPTGITLYGKADQETTTILDENGNKFITATPNNEE
jgi:hypothetical protein